MQIAVEDLLQPCRQHDSRNRGNALKCPTCHLLRTRIQQERERVAPAPTMLQTPVAQRYQLIELPWPDIPGTTSCGC